MSGARYEALDHTGDLGWIVRGTSREDLMRNASVALVDTLVDWSRVEEKIEVRWELQGTTPERLLVRQLEEILFQFDAKGIVFASFDLHLSDSGELSCLARGEPLDREKHGFKTEIKAVTYHQLRIERDPGGGWRAQVILDV